MVTISSLLEIKIEEHSRYMVKEETIRLWEAGLMIQDPDKCKNSTAELVTTKSGSPVQESKNSRRMANMAMEVSATTICMARVQMILSQEMRTTGGIIPSLIRT